MLLCLVVKGYIFEVVNVINSVACGGAEVLWPLRGRLWLREWKADMNTPTTAISGRSRDIDKNILDKKSHRCCKFRKIIIIS